MKGAAHRRRVGAAVICAAICALAGCSNSHSAGVQAERLAFGGLSGAVFGAEGGLPLPVSPDAGGSTVEAFGSFPPSDAPVIPEPIVISDAERSLFTNWLRLDLRAGGFLPERVSDRYHSGIENYDAEVTYRRYGRPLKATGSVERDEFLQHPDYYGVSGSAGESGDSSYRRLEVNVAKSFSAQGLYVTGDFGFGSIDDGISLATCQKIGFYYYPLHLSFIRGGVVYEGRSTDFEMFEASRWNGLRLEGQIYGLGRTLITASYALNIEDSGDAENRVFVETEYFPFDNYHFSFSDEHYFYEDGGWEYLLTFGMSYIHGNRFTFSVDLNIRDSQCAGDATYALTFGMLYRY